MNFQHGSWKCRPRSGCKVIFVPFEAWRPAGLRVDVFTGFVDDGGHALGVPRASRSIGAAPCVVDNDAGNTVGRVGAPGMT